MILLGMTELNDEAPMDEGDFHTDWAVWYGIVSVLSTVFWLYPIIYLIKYVASLHYMFRAHK